LRGGTRKNYRAQLHKAKSPSHLLSKKELLRPGGEKIGGDRGKKKIGPHENEAARNSLNFGASSRIQKEDGRQRVLQNIFEGEFNFGDDQPLVVKLMRDKEF